MDIVTEEDFIGIKFDEVYIPSAFCVEKAESEVSLFSCGFVIDGTCTYIFWGHFNIPSNSETTHTDCTCIAIHSTVLRLP
jgi:hypothetical protein